MNICSHPLYSSMFMFMSMYSTVHVDVYKHVCLIDVHEYKDVHIHHTCFFSFSYVHGLLIVTFLGEVG
jgi:hypothetical protein